MERNLLGGLVLNSALKIYDNFSKYFSSSLTVPRNVSVQANLLVVSYHNSRAYCESREMHLIQLGGQGKS